MQETDREIQTSSETSQITELANMPTEAKSSNKKFIFFIFLFAVSLAGSFYFWTNHTLNKYDKSVNALALGSETQTPVASNTSQELPATPIDPTLPIPITHIDTPSQVKAIYLSSWIAGSKKRDRLFDLVKSTELNSVVIDIKDYTGKLSFKFSTPSIVEENSSERRIRDIRELTNYLHSQNIYVIGRIAVFQDPYFILKHPELAVKTNTDKEKIWRDHKGIAWLDAGSREVWDYALAISKEAYENGFDEINFDYVRFPSDGNLKDIYYPISLDTPRRDVIKNFFEYSHDYFQKEGIKSSVDLFGLVTTQKDDLGIGQILETGLANFDYVAPMVYPSHFAKGAYGYEKPATVPYEIISHSMKRAVGRAQKMGESELKLRPWLQDFDLGATYTADMVRAQISATYDVGLDSWMLWDPSNVYTAGALMNDELAKTDLEQRKAKIEEQKKIEAEKEAAKGALEASTSTTVN